MALPSFLLGIYTKISFKGGPLEGVHQPTLLKDTSHLPSLVYIFSGALTAFPHTHLFYAPSFSPTTSLSSFQKARLFAWFIAFSTASSTAFCT